MAIAKGVADAFKGSVEQLSNKIDEIGNRELRKGITKKNQEGCIKNTSLVLSQYCLTEFKSLVFNLAK